MFSVDPYLAREFDRARYNCWDMIQEAWLELTGFDIGRRTPDPATPLAMMRRFDREESEFERVADGTSPSILLMRRPRVVPHVGLFWRSKVLHIQDSGARYEPLEIAALGFTILRFYRHAARPADRQSA